MFKPTLQVTRLAVIKGRKIIYNEKFHEGVNIIRGDNGHGKSTIINLLVHGLGGEGVNFNSTSLQCDYTLVELTINDITLTLKREISKDTMRPIAIYWGDYETAIKPDSNIWELYPYRGTDKKISFSQVLFKSLGFPEVKTELSSKVTMHQLLRLICKDQMAPVHRIFRSESFDSGNVREEIGGLLCGYNDDDLYIIKSKIRELEDEKKETTKKIEYVRSVFQEAEDVPDIQKITKRINKAKDEREVLCQKLDEQQKNINAEGNTNEKLEQYKKIQKSLKKVNLEIKNIDATINNLNFEIQDSDDFIVYLENNLKSIENSVAVQKVLGPIDIMVCPACFNPIGTSSKEVCPLCKSETNASSRDTNTLKLKQQLNYQIKESKELQKDRNEQLETKQTLLSKLRNEQKGLQLELDRSLSPVTSQNSTVETLNRNIGSLEKEIETLGNRILLAQNIENLINRKADITEELSVLQERVKNIESNIKAKQKEAYSIISQEILSLIEKDTYPDGKPYELDFGATKDVKFSFDLDNICLVVNNGETHDVFAASSHVVLKNAFHFSMLLASCIKQYFRYPRFLIIDSIEDKGMQEERSRNLQKYIVERSEKLNVKYQIIFTTAKIAPELNINKYTIGEFYRGDIKSLKL